MEARQILQKGVFEFGAGAEKRRAQHDAADLRRMRLRIGQRQRGAPRAADQHPALDPAMLADRFHVGDQMWQRIGLALSLRTASPRAALVEQYGVEAFRIEQPPMIRLAAAARAAMQIDRWNTVGAADRFDINLMTIANGQKLCGQRCKGIGAMAS